MNVLITGATGLLGDSVTRCLMDGHQVFALVRETPADPLPSVTYIEQDLTATLELGCFPEKIDTVIHLAQSLAYRDFPNSADDIYDVNVHSTFNLLELARKKEAKHFIFASTGSVYEPYSGEMSEASPVQPSSFYPATKLAAEHLVQAYARFFDVTTLRLFFLFGEKMKKGLIYDLLNRIQNDEPITLTGNQGNGLIFTPTYIGDVSAIIKQFVKTKANGIYNVASNEALSIKEVALMLGRSIGKECVFDLKGNQEQISRLIPDSHKLLEILEEGFAFAPIESALAKSVLSIQALPEPQLC